MVVLRYISSVQEVRRMLLGENRVGKGSEFQVLTTPDGEPAKVQSAVCEVRCYVS